MFYDQDKEQPSIFINHDFMSAELMLQPQKIINEREKIKVYKGQWQKDSIHGEGIVLLSNGLVILGQFKDGYLKDSYFQVRYPNGDIYVGQHKSGVKNGKGQYTYTKQNTVYRGEWLDNIKSGKGELTFMSDNNARFSGTFADDSLLFGEYVDSVGNSFRSLKHPEKT